jgi:GT2 family glycosyltransferase
MVREDFAAFVITYNRPEIIWKTINKIEQQTVAPALLLVLDNSDVKLPEEVFGNWKNKNVSYYFMGGNNGPAAAACYGLEILAEKGFKWILWCDDDNPPEIKDSIERLFFIIDHLDSGKIAGVGAVGHKFNWSTGRINRFDDKEAKDAVLDVDVIAGGMTLILSSEPVLKGILPNPKLFFGFEEYDYCLRLKRAGYRLIVDGNLMSEYRKLKNRINYKSKHNIIPSKDTIWRKYYTYRNLIYLMTYEYGKPTLTLLYILNALAKGFTGFYHGFSFGINHFRMVLLAISDGLTKKIGKTIIPVEKNRSHQ